MSGQRTYSHLLGARRVPTQYDVVSAKLLYYPAHGFAVETPTAEWYRRHQIGSPLQAADWELFSDPEQTTYATYTERRAAGETVLDGLEACPDPSFERGYFERLDAAFAPLRFPYHAMTMASAYLGSVAPAGKIALVAGFQAMDELRCVHRFARRLKTLQKLGADVGADARGRWERDPEYQPLREAIERVLVTYDFGELFVALCLVLKPAIDELVLAELGRTARRHGDETLARTLWSLGEDAEWHRGWARALARLCLGQRADNLATMRAWRDKWRPIANAAVEALAPVLADGAAADAVAARCADFERSCGLGEDLD